MAQNQSHSQTAATGEPGRERRIMDAAAGLFARHGFDKTTVDEIADAAGVSKGAIYLHFESKDALFEAVLAREMTAHTEAWLELLEADPEGGTLGGIYRNTLRALQASPLMTAIMRQDQQVIGSYLRKPDSLFETDYAKASRVELVERLQEAGVVRRDVDPKVASHVMDVLGYGLVRIGDVRSPDEFPPLEDVLTLVGEILDRALSPEGGADSEAGKAVLREMVGSATKPYLEEVQARASGREGE